MTLTEQIDIDLKEAMKAQKPDLLSLLRMLKAAIKNSEIALGHPATEQEVLAVLEKQAKQRRDSIAQYKDGGRADLAEKEASELAIIEKYLPDKMPIEELELLVAEAIADLAATSLADTGKVIQAVMGRANGAADGKTVSEIVRKKLQ